MYRLRPPRESSENWFKRNESIITSITSITALIVSIYVMIDQKNIAKKNLDFTQQQISLAKAQFDTSLNDRLANQRERVKELYESSLRQHYQDSLSKVQATLFSKQIRMQEYMNNSVIENEKPRVRIDSLTRLNSIYYNIFVTNIGKRLLKITSMDMAYMSYDTLYTADTLIEQLILAPGEQGSGSFTLDVPDSIVNLTYTGALMNIKFTDELFNRREAYSATLSFSVTNPTERLQYGFINDPNIIKVFKTALLTKNYKAISSNLLNTQTERMRSIQRQK